jgi:phage-related protein
MSAFVWVPDFGAAGTKKPNVSVIKFGEGYEQRSSFGMNTSPESWSLSFNNRDQAEFILINDFLSARGAVEAFSWTPPDATTARIFVCREWTKTRVKGTFYSISATFDEVFEFV